MTLDLKEKILKLQKQTGPEAFDDESQQQFQVWLGELEDLEEYGKLAKHYLVGKLIAKFQKEIVSLNGILLAKRQLETVERLNIMDRIDLYKEFINLFSIESRTTSIQEKLSKF